MSTAGSDADESDTLSDPEGSDAPSDDEEAAAPRDPENAVADGGDDWEMGEPDIDDVLEDLEELENMVDSEAEREQVREAMRTARRASDPHVFGRIRDTFDLRDVGEAAVGSFIFGIPMVVEEGTLEIGAAIADSVPAMVATVAFGFALALGILYAADFEEVEADMLLGFVPIRLVNILAVSAVLAVGLMTLWGRVDWAEPRVAFAQCLVTAVVMVVGASLGDILPE